MICAIRDHQRKSYGIRDALRSEGWWVVPVGAPADVLLVDHDLARVGYRDIIQAYEEKGTRIVLYPHGTHPWSVCMWDGIHDPYPGVDLFLVTAEGHREVLERYGYPRPVEVIGWSVCEQREWRPLGAAGGVLFCPQHPLGSGYLRESFKEVNRAALATVLGWGSPVTVRHVGSLEQNGLEELSDVRYERARMDTTVGSIDDHDLVVARDTVLSLAVARGVSAVTFHQEPLTDDPEEGEPTMTVANWDRYANLVRFPFDLEDEDVLFRATTQSPAEWRERFVGPQLDPSRLSELLLELCGRQGPLLVPPSNGGRRVSERASV